MKLSIITVNLNNALGLKKTLESVRMQRFRDFEHLIIDGGSSDNSIDVIKEFDSGLSYWISEPDNGVYFGQNKGIDKSTGEYLLFLNSGDELAGPNVLDGLLNQNNGSDLIYGNMIQEFPDGTKNVVRMPPKIKADFLLKKTLCHPSTLIHRNLFQKYGQYDTRYRIVADWAFFLKVILLQNASYEHKELVVSVFRMDGMSASLSNQHFIISERKEVISSLFSSAMLDYMAEKEHFESYYRRLRLDLSIRTFRHIKDLGLKFKGDLRRISGRIKFPYRTFLSRISLKRYEKRYADECKKIPIIINNRNHLTYLQRLIRSLEERGYRDIYILDNNSDFPPLVDYYNNCPYEVIRLGKNAGYCALWDTPVFERFKDQYYIYTDSDLELVPECPDGFVAALRYYLEKYTRVGKAGLSIVTNDLPEQYALRNEVLEKENKNIKRRLENLVLDAKVDTTFALYRPNQFGDALKVSAIRLASPYSARHLPWYEDTADLNFEQMYYYTNANKSSSWGTLLKEIMVNESNCHHTEL